MKKKEPITYKQAGVNIDAGNQLVEAIKPAIATTKRPGVMGTIGGFGGLFDLSSIKCNTPVLVSGTDGVGTKLKIAQQLNDHSKIGIDLVAMCVNDILTVGAEPLFFLDYYACGQLQPSQATSVIHGIVEGCKQSGCALIGGETAEMPGMYQNSDYDLAGFVVGVVDKNQIIDGKNISDKNEIIAIESSGPHSNGYSLIRKIIDHNNIDINEQLENKTIAQRLIEPTYIYADVVSALNDSAIKINGIAHITGGGLSENISRILPNDLSAKINLSSYQLPIIFQWLQEQGSLSQSEMLRTFNCGVGMAVIVKSTDTQNAIETIKSFGKNAWRVGHITSTEKNKTVFVS